MSQDNTPNLPAICTELRMRLDDGAAVVSSRDVAAIFDKEHKNVLRDIDIIRAQDIGSDVSQSWFRETTAKDSYGRDQRAVDLTKDGFVLLAMGWTGEKAQIFKVRYIKAFNAMEQALRANYARIVQIDHALASMMNAQAQAVQSLQSVEYKVDQFSINYRPPRLDITETVKSEHVRALSLMGGRCPCCSRAKVITDDGKRSAFAEFDHFYQNSLRDPSHTWLICKLCHKDFTTGRVARSDRTAEFAAYQNKRLRLPGAQPSLF